MRSLKKITSLARMRRSDPTNKRRLNLYLELTDPSGNLMLTSDDAELRKEKAKSMAMNHVRI